MFHNTKDFPRYIHIAFVVKAIVSVIPAIIVFILLFKFLAPIPSTRVAFADENGDYTITNAEDIMAFADDVKYQIALSKQEAAETRAQIAADTAKVEAKMAEYEAKYQHGASVEEWHTQVMEQTSRIAADIEAKRELQNALTAEQESIRARNAEIYEMAKAHFE